jgi:probable HAF family extracellular repeat protein
MSRLGTATVSRRTLLTGAAAAVGAPLAIGALGARAPVATRQDPEGLTLLAAGRSDGPVSTDATIGFRFDRGRYTLFDLPDSGDLTVLNGITERGEIVGKYLDDGGMFHGVLRDRRGRYWRIDVPGAMGTYAIKVNEAGQIVGTSNDTDRQVTALGGKGYLLDRGRFITINPDGAVFSQALGINNRRQVVGEFIDRDGRNRGFLWQRGRFTFIDVPNSAGGSVVDINDHGDMVGIYGTDLGMASIRCFLVRNGRLITFDLPGGAIPFLTDINNRGQIAGTIIGDPADPSTFRGFLLARGPGGPLTTIRPPDSAASFVGGLNDRGQLCGTADNPDAAGQPAMGMMTMMGVAG